MQYTAKHAPLGFGRYINFLVVFKEFLETIPDVQQILAVRYMELYNLSLTHCKQTTVQIGMVLTFK